MKGEHMSEVWHSYERESCPVCGEGPDRDVIVFGSIVGCYKCGMYAAISEDAYESEENWNRLARRIREKLCDEVNT